MDGQEVRLRRVATYERVSSEDQRERQTIKTQRGALERRLEAEPNVVLVERYVDDGVSGTIPMTQRPAGHQLMRDAAQGRFDEVWVYRYDRLGRDEVDPLVIWKSFERLGITVFSVTEGNTDLFMYSIHVVMNAQERRTFLARSADGMNRAAQEGRYCGGIVPRGYRVEGRKQTARLVPNDQQVIWGAWTEAGLIRQIYHWLAYEGWSCRRIAHHLNDLGVPTAYQRDGRGIRGKHTQGLWRPGHVRNLVTNPVYRGELQYGRRSTKKGREVISAPVDPLVSQEVWQAAQDTLRAHRLITREAKHPHLLRGIIVCGICGLHYCSAGEIWYRCNGQIVERGPVQGPCPSKSIKRQWLEPLVWGDVERWLRDPGALVLELDGMQDQKDAVAEAERTALEQLLVELPQERQRVLDLHIKGRIEEGELDAFLADIDRRRTAAAKRLADLRAEDENDGPPVTADLLEELQRRLDAGLSFEQRREIVRLLVKRIVVHTTVDEHGKKTAKVVIEYRFPNLSVVLTGTDTRAWANT
ncbi:MAG: recombinase family protein [Chloroflexi bacterium]|nr:recombinase family protein [Chloroflexota bacterium]